MATSAVTQGTLPASLVDSINGVKPAAAASTGADTSDRFLKLLITQMQNQDPLNPMDNAQVTSQMAQINTVTGIEKLNSSVNGLSNSFSQMQVMQGVSLVGRTVQLEGNALYTKDGKSTGAFDLTAAVGNASVDIIGKSGQIVGTLDMGARPAGRQNFNWTPPASMDTAGLTFKVTTTTGSVRSTPVQIMTDTVDAVSNRNGTLTLQLRNGGTQPYSAVQSLS